MRDQPCGSSSSPKVFQATETSKFLCTFLNLYSKSKLLPTLISVYKLPTQLMHELCSLYFSVTGGPVSHQPICYVVRLHHLSGVTVTAWWRMIGTFMCLEEQLTTLYLPIYTGMGAPTPHSFYTPPPPDISFRFEQFILFFTRSIKTQFVNPVSLHLRTFLFVSSTIPACQFFPPKTKKNKITLYGSLGLKHLHGLVLSLHKEGNHGITKFYKCVSNDDLAFPRPSSCNGYFGKALR